MTLTETAPARTATATFEMPLSVAGRMADIALPIVKATAKYVTPVITRVQIIEGTAYATDRYRATEHVLPVQDGAERVHEPIAVPREALEALVKAASADKNSAQRVTLTYDPEAGVLTTVIVDHSTGTEVATGRYFVEAHTGNYPHMARLFESRDAEQSNGAPNYGFSAQFLADIAATAKKLAYKAATAATFFEFGEKPGSPVIVRYETGKLQEGETVRMLLQPRKGAR